MRLVEPALGISAAADLVPVPALGKQWRMLRASMKHMLVKTGAYSLSAPIYASMLVCCGDGIVGRR